MRRGKTEQFGSSPAAVPLTPLAGGGGLHRKKSIGVRSWLILNSAGQTQTLEAGKYAIMRRTGIPARDLRALDPILSYPSTILGRERAIVINLEHIKAIVTAQEVLMLNSIDPSVSAFVGELQGRIFRHHHASKRHQKEEENSEGGPQTTAGPTRAESGAPWFFQNQDSEARRDANKDLENKDGSKVLPFEFVALEACLEAACSSLEHEALTLDLEAHPALDKLTSKVNTLNLERVRQIKSRLVMITGRVQKVRDELEHLLDDDEDMAEMYLTEKISQQSENSSVSSVSSTDAIDEDLPIGEVDDRFPPEVALEANRDSVTYEGEHQTKDAHTGLGKNSHGVDDAGTPRSGISKSFDVKELEMVLEAYFVQIDGTLNKLSTLKEYVDDTEDYINIMQDDKQNQLLQMGVMLTTATLMLSIFIVVAGIFGMNIRIEIFNDQVHGMQRWITTVVGGFAGIIGLYVSAIGWWKHKRIL